MAQSPSCGRSDGAPRSYTALLQISLATFCVGAFFLSRSYTPPLYVYLALAVAAAQIEGRSPIETGEVATAVDWRNILLLTVGGVVLMMLMVRVLA